MNARVWIIVSGGDKMTGAQTENNGRNWSISLGWSYIVRMKSQLGLRGRTLITDPDRSGHKVSVQACHQLRAGDIIVDQGLSAGGYHTRR